jgi:hypothetical protein
VSLPEDLVNAWADLARPAKRKSVRADLERIAAEHVRWRAQERHEASRAEANATLKVVSATAAALRSAEDAYDEAQLHDRLEREIRSLNDEAEWLLVNELANRTGDRRVFGDIDLVIASAPILPEICLSAIDRSRGPNPDNSLQLTVGRLLECFERWSGRRATHTPAVATAYDGYPHSEAGGLVLEFMGQIEPGIRPTAVSTALACWVASRRKKPRRDQTI